MLHQVKYRPLFFIFVSAIVIFNSCKVASPTDLQTTQTPPSPPGKTDRPPGAPAFLQAKATSLSTVDLDWMDTSQITAWFVIERESSNDTVWRVVDSIP